MDSVRAQWLRSGFCALILIFGACSFAHATTEFIVPPGADATPFGITKGPDGNVWFTEQTRGAVAKISATLMQRTAARNAL